MKSSSYFLILLFITLSINSIKNETSNSSIKCGKVFDGLTNGSIDMEIQTSTTTIAANWVDFGDEVLLFEWAIVSDSFRIPVASMTSGLIFFFLLFFIFFFLNIQFCLHIFFVYIFFYIYIILNFIFYVFLRSIF